MSDVWLGRTPPEGSDRDATHVAVVPMTAAEDLAPGAHVGVVGVGLVGTGAEQKIGIVDPFLTLRVVKGARFYLCLYPQSVSGLRHVYLHPVLDGDLPVTSRDWLKRCAAGLGVTYDAMMDHAQLWVDTHDSKWGGDYWVGGSEFEGVRIPDEFWEHYDRVKGTHTPEPVRQNFITCSC